MAIPLEPLGYSTAALLEGNVREALQIRNRLSGTPGKFDESTKRRIEFMLQRTPQLLADCPVKVTDALRIAAALMELWGISNIRQFVSVEGQLDYRFGITAIAHMIHSHGCFLENIESLKSSGIKRVQFMGANDPDDCRACRAADGKRYSISKVPELPLIGCKCKNQYGCRVGVCVAF